MNLFDAIKHRRSVRTFDGEPLSESEKQQVLTCAQHADNPWQLPIEWKILSAEKDGLKSPVISGTDTFIAGKMQKLPMAELAFGYSFEKVVLFAENIGIGTTWIAGTMDRSAFERAVSLEENEVMPCVSPLGYPAKKMGLKEVLMRKGIKADTRLPFGEVFFDKNFAEPMTEEKAGEVLGRALEAVRWAPSAVNKQPWRLVADGNSVHFYMKKSKGFTGSNGWDIQKIDMGIAICHYAMMLEEAGKKLSFVQSDPDISHAEDVIYITTCVAE